MKHYTFYIQDGDQYQRGFDFPNYKTMLLFKIIGNGGFGYSLVAGKFNDILLCGSNIQVNNLISYIQRIGQNEI